ncbi:MAG: alanine--tRNA ligase, partial [Acholeplasmatales bacterium]|nr:alanine--tRNA ligase [Acholeplasmatales bacterium]
MRYMSSNEIRKTWLDFFKDHQHVIIPSSPLVPKNDRTLLWINAGVAPLKKYFDGSVTPPAKRLTNIQKCIRTNDIENVGLTARHHTFFEMMGNFSIGDYFKVEAIKLASILLFSDKYFGFPKNLIYITYYPADTICYEQWLKEGLSSDHLIPLESNFWEIGPGPSGPDTEVFFDRGEAYDARGSELIANDLENDRFIEIGNIVFSQFNANPKVDRSLYLELPHKNIDTGFGLERFACVLQGTKTNFETDLFYPIIEEVERLTKIKYQGQMAFKVIADHIKALSMAIADGALISNVGRGYVLRRILRRALNYGHQLNLNEPFLYKLVDVTCEIMKTFYPDIQTKVEIVKEIIKNEEKQFLKTLLEGENIFNSYIENHDFIDGDFAFKLYDTYGFPIELTKEMAISKNLKIDLDGYQKHLIKQKEDSRNNKKQLGMESQNAEYLNFWEKSKFLGYDTYETSSKVIKIFPAGIVLDVTPFYATSGGQVCDKGRINNIPIQEVTKLPNGQFLHH